MLFRVLLLVVVTILFSQSLICSSAVSEVTSEGAAVEKAAEEKVEDLSTKPSKEEIVLTNNIGDKSIGGRFSTERNGFKKRGIGSNIKFGNKRVDRKEEEKNPDSTKENINMSDSSSEGGGKPRGLWDHLVGKSGEEALKAINESKFER
jgi:hypothetical protein